MRCGQQYCAAKYFVIENIGTKKPSSPIVGQVWLHIVINFRVVDSSRIIGRGSYCVICTLHSVDLAVCLFCKESPFVVMEIAKKVNHQINKRINCRNINIWWRFCELLVAHFMENLWITDWRKLVYYPINLIHSKIWSCFKSDNF